MKPFKVVELGGVLVVLEMNPELEVRTAVDDENSTKQDRMKKQTKPSQAIRRVFREVSNETAHAVNGNSKALRSSENIARKIGKVSEKGTSTEDLPEKKFLCDRCQQNFSHDYDEGWLLVNVFLLCLAKQTKK